jgi:hypothetical protein
MTAAGSRPRALLETFECVNVVGKELGPTRPELSQSGDLSGEARWE